jgi:hypothetical protein
MVSQIDLHATAPRREQTRIGVATPTATIATSPSSTNDKSPGNSPISNGHEGHSVHTADDGVLSSIAGGDQAAIDYTRSRIIYSRPDFTTIAQ